jgi:hypothetical protein
MMKMCAELGAPWDFKKVKLFVMLSIVLLSSLPSMAGPILEWDPSPEPHVIGYRVYLGNESRSYSQVFDAGPQTSWELTSLIAGATYFIAVTAVAEDGLESDFSEEIVYTPGVDGVTSALLPQTISVSSENVEVSFSGAAGQECHVLFSTDLMHWRILSTVTGDGTSLRVVDSGHRTRPMSFYRVVGVLDDLAAN